MGHKVHPTGFRIGIIRDWQSKWYSDTHYAEFVEEDNKLREAIQSKYREAAISLMEIDRQAKDVTITLYTARPGIVIGRGGQRVDEMRHFLEGLTGKRIRLNIQEVRQPELDAYLVARSVAEQIERRVAYRRAVKQAIFRTIQAGARGIKISCSGRLGNSEIARRQTSHEGQVPLHTLRADIDYGFTEARTTLGRIGVKVWIYKGQILPELKEGMLAEAAIEEAPVETAEAVPEEAAKPLEAPVEASPPEEAPAEPVEATAETAEAVPEEAAKPAEAPVEAAPPEEAPAEPIEATVETAEAAPEETEAVPAEASSEAEVKAEPTEAAVESAEAPPAAEPEAKPAKPRATRATKAAKAAAEKEEKPAKPAARKTAKAARAAKAETNTEVETTSTEEEAQDATA